MIKNIDKEMRNKLAELINSVPTQKRKTPNWKTDIIVLTYKKQDKKSCNNYRKITLSIEPETVFARIIQNKIRNKSDATVKDIQCEYRKKS